jgi:hypothetical protein
LRLQTLFIVVLFLIFSSGYSHSANLAPSDSPENFIQCLYRDHLSQYDIKYWFDNKEKLSKYFDSTLTALFLRDEECKNKTGGICNLDFDPIIDAQDLDNKYPVSIEVKRLNYKSQTRCKVIFTNITKRTICYELRRTKLGWRVSDITYSNGQSLKKLLSQKPCLKNQP